MNARSVALVARGTALAFFFSLPFGTKKFLFSFPFSFSNVYIGEYTSAFLFGTDLLLIACVVLAFARYRAELLALLVRFWQPVLFVALAALSLFLASYPALGFYTLIRLALVVLAAFALAAFLRGGALSLRAVAATLATSSALQAVIGIGQFIRGKSVGLTLLGEPVIAEATKGVGHVVIGGGEFLRALGTMPHANILAGFLVLGLGCFCYLFLTRRPGDIRTFIVIVAGIIIVTVGLVVTFSRSGWITALILLVAALAAGMKRRETRARALELLATLALIGVFLAFTLGWAILPRAGFAPGEGSVAHRYLYDLIGLDIIFHHPFGVGMGNQLLRTVDEGWYALRGLEHWWEWQPIHNLYLMVATEVGIPGLAAFLWFLGALVLSTRSFRGEGNIEADLVAVLLGSLLIFGLFDHFLWDLQAGRLLLWSVVGILMGIYRDKEKID
ncbi:MAG: O-antigen ligase family protein [Patescibacteria group bacterium]